MKQILLCSMFAFLCLLKAPGQNNPIKVSGTVTDAGGEALIGVNIVEKGTTNGTVTNVDGKYEIQVSSPGHTLTFSFIGYKPQEQTVGQKNVIDVVLEENLVNIDEVVVTALGISREKKALGYSVQDVSGNLLDNHVSNFASSLTGKVAGMNINSNSSVGSSARITIRGESSINYQANQPLFVIDGVPMGNDAVQNYSKADFGSSIADLNSADVESVSVLKGPAASALYGSRAANGVILITTRSGKGTKGLGISYTGTYSWEKPLILPKMQDQFGMGNAGIYEGGTFGCSDSPFYPQSGQEDSMDESWGPRFDGQPRVQFDSPTTNGHRAGDLHIPNRGDVIASPWVAHPNNMKDFFSGGFTRVNNLAITGSNEHSSIRTSITYHDQKGLTPNNTLKRLSLSANGTTKVNDWLDMSVVANYVKSKSDNRPELGYGRETPMYFFVWLPQSHNINSYRDYWQSGLEGVRQFQGNYGENHNNPYFYQYENTTQQNKDHFFGNVKFDVSLAEGLKLMVRGGTDFYNDSRPRQMAYSTSSNPQGFYQETSIRYQETNIDGLISYYKRLENGLRFDINAGGNYMDVQSRTSSATANSLTIPDVYSLSNSKEIPAGSSWGYHKRTNSLYANFQADYKSMVYLDISGRNDWSSTLPTDNNSYFYPSFTTSILLNQIFSLPTFFNLVKLRGGWAQVGNDTAPYNLRTVYNTNGFFGNVPLISEESTLKNPALKPERSSTVETGFELALFGNRLHADFSWYTTDSKDQILALASTPVSGYSSRIVNAGCIRNRGIELMVGGNPLRSTNGINWDINVNFARNRGKVASLTEGIDELVVSAPGEDAKMVARVGERTGQLYGPGFKRVADGDMKGDIIIGSNGIPLIEDNVYLGNANPDWTMGINNNFSYQGFELGFLFDIRHGGVIISHTLNKMIGAGQFVESADGRANRIPGNEYKDPYYHKGAALVGNEYTQNLMVDDGTYSQGVYGTDARSFHKDYYDHNSEAQLIDGSFAKLRELKFGYTFPQRWVSKLALQRASIYFIGRDLLLFTKNQHFDPESAVSSTDNGLVLGFEDLTIPASRSFGLQINLTF